MRSPERSFSRNESKRGTCFLIASLFSSWSEAWRPWKPLGSLSCWCSSLVAGTGSRYHSRHGAKDFCLGQFPGRHFLCILLFFCLAGLSFGRVFCFILSLFSFAMSPPLSLGQKERVVFLPIYLTQSSSSAGRATVEPPTPLCVWRGGYNGPACSFCWVAVQRERRGIGRPSEGLAAG